MAEARQVAVGNLEERVPGERLAAGDADITAGDAREVGHAPMVFEVKPELPLPCGHGLSVHRRGPEGVIERYSETERPGKTEDSGAGKQLRLLLIGQHAALFPGRLLDLAVRGESANNGATGAKRHVLDEVPGGEPDPDGPTACQDTAKIPVYAA